MSAFAVRNTDSDPISSEKMRICVVLHAHVVEALPDRVRRCPRKAVEIDVQAVHEVQVVVHRLSGLAARRTVAKLKRPEPGLEPLRHRDRAKHLAGNSHLSPPLRQRDSHRARSVSANTAGVWRGPRDPTSSQSNEIGRTEEKVRTRSLRGCRRIGRWRPRRYFPSTSRRPSSRHRSAGLAPSRRRT